MRARAPLDCVLFRLRVLGLSRARVSQVELVDLDVDVDLDRGD